MLAFLWTVHILYSVHNFHLNRLQIGEKTRVFTALTFDSLICVWVGILIDKYTITSNMLHGRMVPCQQLQQQLDNPWHDGAESASHSRDDVEPLINVSIHNNMMQWTASWSTRVMVSAAAGGQWDELAHVQPCSVQANSEIQHQSS